MYDDRLERKADIDLLVRNCINIAVFCDGACHALRSGLFGAADPVLRANTGISASWISPEAVRLVDALKGRFSTPSLSTCFPRPADNVQDPLHWSGMVMLDGPTEHPSYETYIHHSTNAHVSVTGDTSRACTIFDNALLWKVVVTKPEDSQIRAWPSIAVVPQVERSLAEKLLKPFRRLEMATGGAGNELFSLLQNLPSKFHRERVQRLTRESV
ncbi:hypothetical protein JVT61DRAFT_14663 [Boletus reticuloceps]|uniref:Uncharacterized protein n=1 Tax=Boletus reticuloceps TaxID=495285 RepID=A0A8I2YUF3_9AGAM|nr:hypothetical protein JVT61DRAFT_14663 [Boletus reticuloceps]